VLVASAADELCGFLHDGLLDVEMAAPSRAEDASTARRIGAAKSPAFRRRVKPGLEKLEILRFAFEDLCAREHVGTGQFVRRAVQIAELEFALTQAKMQKWVADSVRTMHRQRQVVSAGGEVLSQKVGIADGSQDPRRRLPLRLRLREQVPGGPVLL